MSTIDRSLVSDSPTTPAGGAALPRAPVLEPEQRIGGYRIRELLGEGGMGQVFLAEQSEPVSRLVALKVMSAPVPTGELALRFALERQALARLEHPNIARLYEAGETATGSPWFAMELVDGAPITRYADAHRLDLVQRVTLFLEVCNAVRHAHRRGILHRDLKPTNVLVTEVDERAVPKVIDFGIAKSIDATHDAAELGTHVIGSPAYLPPETLDAVEGGADVDTRADVYSLGVMLYELLAGALPFDFGTLTLLQVMRHVADEDAPPPRSRFMGLPRDRRDAIVAARRTTPAVLARELAGDLGWIVQRAIARARDDRYGSVDELAIDLGRWLKSEPTAAAPPGAIYHLRKFAKRRRGPVIAVAVVILALVIGVVARSIEAARAEREAAAARVARAEAERVTSFLVDLFRVSAPNEARGNSVTARELLDRGASRIPSELADQPALQARMMRTIGSVYLALGLQRDAEPLIARAEKAARGHLRDDDPEKVRAIAQIAELRQQQGRYPDARALYEEARALVDRGATLAPPELASLLEGNARTLRMQRELDLAGPLLLRAFELRRTSQGVDHPDVARNHYSQGQLASDRGDYPRAEAHFRAAIEAYERSTDPFYPALAGPLRGLADVLDEQDRFEQAEPLYLRAIAIAEKSFDADHPLLAIQYNNLGVTYWNQKRYDDAGKYFARALASHEKRLGADHPEVGIARSNIALVEWKHGDLDAAERDFRTALAVLEPKLAATDPALAWSWWGLGSVLAEAKRYDEAIPLLRKAYELRKANLPPGHRDTKDAEESLNSALKSRQ